MTEASKFYGPLAADNAPVLLIDHQVGLYTAVRDISLLELKHNAPGLAKAATALRLPLVVTTTAADSMWGPLIPELQEVLPEGQEVIDRASVNAWHDERFRTAPEATGRKKLIITGSPSKSAPHCRPSARPPPATTPTSPSTAAVPSQRPNATRVCCACSRQG